LFVLLASLNIELVCESEIPRSRTSGDPKFPDLKIGTALKRHVNNLHFQKKNKKMFPSEEELELLGPKTPMHAALLVACMALANFAMIYVLGMRRC